MIVTTKQLEAEMSYMREELRMVNDKYWKLWHAHQRLLDHLQLHEVQIPQDVVLRKKPKS